MSMPSASAAIAISAAFKLSSSHPRRILSVTGTSTASITDWIISKASFGSRIKAEPDKAPVTFRAGQPIFMSIISAPASSQAFAPIAIQCGSRPTSWMESGSTSPCPEAFAIFSASPAANLSLATISETTKPGSKCCKTLRNGKSVTPDIGAIKTRERKACLPI